MVCSFLFRRFYNSDDLFIKFGFCCGGQQWTKSSYSCGIKIHIYSQYLRCVSLTYPLSILKAETYNIGVFS